MATINPAAIANAKKAETLKHLNMYNILNNINIAAQKTVFPYDGLIPQKIQFNKANITINTIVPKPNKNTTFNKTGGDPNDSDDEVLSHTSIIFYD